MLTGRYPFVGKNLKNLYYNILTNPVEDDDVPDFVKKMLEKDRKKRISLA